MTSYLHQNRNLDGLQISLPHKARLQWFLDHQDQIIPYHAFGAFDNPGLTTKAKGIYKPRDWEYVLSIRETPGSPYGDIPIAALADGQWIYRYHREDGDNMYTNRGLIRCMENGIPIGVMIQVTPKPQVKYFVAGLGLIRQFNDPWFDLISWRSIAFEDGFERQVAEDSGGYMANPLIGNLPNLTSSSDDERYSQQLVRPNQPMFRVLLLGSYGRTCAITRSEVVPALEAAHIRPYSQARIDHIDNGLLLRADVHRLFDRGLMGVNTSHMEVVLSPKLVRTEYEQYENQPLLIPRNPDLQPSTKYLDEHRRRWQLR